MKQIESPMEPRKQRVLMIAAVAKLAKKNDA